MEQITKPHCGARLDRLPDCRWHSSMFAIVAFGLLVCWSNAVGGLILAQLKALGWTDNSTTATFSAITTTVFYRFNVDLKNHVGKYDGHLSKTKHRG